MRGRPHGASRRGEGAPAEGRLPILLRRALPDVVGVGLVVVAAVAVMVPALAHGASLGPFDLLSRYGLTRRTGVTVHNGQTVDQIAEMIPWTTLSWTQVHQGHLPLWNPYNGLGLPLAFNWQSAVFSLPTLVSYAAPLHLAYTVQVMVTLVLGGSGAYVFARVMGLHVLACVMAGVVYELSGEFMGFLGWPVATVMAWAGWLFAAVVLVVRGRHRVGAVVLLALSGAWAVYAGQPDALLLLAIGLCLFVTVVLVAEGRRRLTWRAVRRPVFDLVVAGGAGAALAAPLALPGVQLVRGSVFLAAGQGGGALSPYDAVNFLFQGFNGLPAARSQWFGAGSTAYVGVIAAVLAVTGVAVRRRQPEVLGLAVTAGVLGALAFVPALAWTLNDLPLHARWHLGLAVVAFAAAMLAAVGTDVLLRWPTGWLTRVWLGGGFAVAAVVEAGLWLVGRGHLAPASARLRDESFVWPVLCTALGLLVVGALARAARPGEEHRRRGPVGKAGPATVLLACEGAFLVGVGGPVFSSNPTFLPATPAVDALRSAVGSSVVGFGVKSCQLPPTLGILPEANAAFGVRELSAYDPITPRADFAALHVPQSLPVSAFCPRVRSAVKARRYGVAFVLEPRHARGPRGTVYVRTVGHEALYRVPGAAAATLVPLTPGGGRPGPDVPGVAVAVHHPDAATWRVDTDGARRQLLRLRLTDVPGWHATLDGRPVALAPFAGMMLQVTVPAGRHTVDVRYWPETFTAGLVLAAASGTGLATAAVLGWRRRARRAPAAWAGAVDGAVLDGAGPPEVTEAPAAPASRAPSAGGPTP